MAKKGKRRRNGKPPLRVTDVISLIVSMAPIVGLMANGQPGVAQGFSSLVEVHKAKGTAGAIGAAMDMISVLFTGRKADGTDLSTNPAAFQGWVGLLTGVGIQVAAKFARKVAGRPMGIPGIKRLTLF